MNSPARRPGGRRLLIVLLVTVGMLLSGCGGAPAEDSQDPATRTIEDLFGPVEVPDDPQRVVAGDGVTLGTMLALGVTPVAAAVNPHSLPQHLAEQMEGIVEVTEGDGINWEKLLAQDPDLFITFAGTKENPWNKETCDRAAEVIPAFCYVYNYVRLEDIKRNLTEVARVLNRQEEATEVLDALDQRIEHLEARVAAAGLTDKPVSTLRLMEDGTYSIRIGTSESIAFRALGIAQPAGQTNPADFSINISAEKLDVLDTAHTLFVYVDDDASGERDKLASSPLWKTLPAVKEGRVHFVNSGVWNSADVVGLDLILDDIERYFIEPAEAG